MTYIKVLGVTFTAVIFLIIFMDAIIQSVQERSVEPIFHEVGDRLLMASKSLQTESRGIIAQEGVYDGSGGLLKGIWSTLKTMSALIGAIIIVWAWLRLLTWFWEQTPYSLNSFSNYSLAFVTYWILQFIILIVNASTTGREIVFSGSQDSVTYYLIQPVLSVVDFLKALPFLLKPVSEAAKKLEVVATHAP